MPRLIDADDILPMMERKMDMQDLYLPIHFKEMVIDEMPTMDAVPVVRCGECKWFDISEPSGTVEPIGYICHRKYIFVESDDFCKRGERRENETSKR